MTDEQILRELRGSGSAVPREPIVISRERAAQLKQELTGLLEVRGDHWLIPHEFYYGTNQIPVVAGFALSPKRLVWLLYRKDEPMGQYQVRSACRFTLCANPDHLRLSDCETAYNLFEVEQDD